MSDDLRDAEPRINQESLDELAEHFHEHESDAGDLPWDEATDVTIERPELEDISIRLPRDDVTLLKAEAARLGVDSTTLVRMVLRRYLREAKAR